MTLGNSGKLLGVFSVLPFFMAYVLLTSMSGQVTSFSTGFLFLGIGLWSLVMAWIARQQGFEPFRWYDGKFDRHDIKWMIIGFAGLFMAALVIPTYLIHGSIGIIIALGVGGGVLAYVLFKSQTFLVNWFVHGFYNIVVTLLVTASIIPKGASAIFVPTFAADPSIAISSSIITSIVSQFVFVSLAEEAMKVSVSNGLLMLITKNVKVAWTISIILWSLAHTVIAYKIVIPFLH